MTTAGARVDKLGVAFSSPLRIEYWFRALRGRLTLWRVKGGGWVEVATSTSTRVLTDRAWAWQSGQICVTRAGSVPPAVDHLEPAKDGALFAW